MDIKFITGKLEDAIISGEKLEEHFRSIPAEVREAQRKELAPLIAIEAVANEIEAGITDFDELRSLSAKHVFDAGGDPDDTDVVNGVIRAAELTANGTRVIDRFERLVA